MTMPTRVVLAGYGRVGQAFAELAARREDVEVAAVLRSTGPTLAEVLDSLRCDVVADATPTDLATGGPALEHGRTALARGIHFATAAKGPLVTAYRELVDLAAANGAGFRFSAATGAGLPTVDTVEFCLAGAAVDRIEGVLNGTSNFVLDEMAKGVDIERALTEARQLGISDGDGRQDVSGADTAAKLVTLVNAIWDRGMALGDVEVEGIEQLAPETVRAAAGEGSAYRLVGSADRFGTASVAPRRLERSHPLAAIGGAEKGITFTTDLFGALTLLGGRSDPTAAGAALLRDVLLLARVGGRA
jgi:homoserine dehydrogenase